MSKKAAAPAPPENHERWIVSYADMVTLLWALFVVLYAISNSDPRKLLVVQQSIDKAFSVGVLSGSQGASPLFEGGGGMAPTIGEIKTSDFAQISEKITAFARLNDLQSRIQVRSDATSITISLSDNLLFDSGSADLKPGSQQVLGEVAAVLKNLPNELRIEGHTDNVPVNSIDYPTNWELSAARASTVLRFLVETGGLRSSHAFLAGYAETRPIADNATQEGRALNRRADIVIIYPTQEEVQRILSGAKGR